jgi:hypothetical protein
LPCVTENIVQGILCGNFLAEAAQGFAFCGVKKTNKPLIDKQIDYD